MLAPALRDRLMAQAEATGQPEQEGYYQQSILKNSAAKWQIRDIVPQDTTNLWPIPDSLTAPEYRVWRLAPNSTFSGGAAVQCQLCRSGVTEFQPALAQ